MLVDIPKYDLPILAETKKKIVTVKIDAKRRAQEVGSNMSARFQMGDVLAGYLEKKYRGRYLLPGAQVATSPLAW